MTNQIHNGEIDQELRQLLNITDGADAHPAPDNKVWLLLRAFRGDAGETTVGTADCLVSTSMLNTRFSL